MYATLAGSPVVIALSRLALKCAFPRGGSVEHQRCAFVALVEGTFNGIINVRIFLKKGYLPKQID